MFFLALSFCTFIVNIDCNKHMYNFLAAVFQVYLVYLFEYYMSVHYMYCCTLYFLYIFLIHNTHNILFCMITFDFVFNLTILFATVNKFIL